MMWRSLLLVSIFTVSCGEPQKYMDGKDTIRSFGDGTWTIDKTGGSPSSPRKIHLFNRETQDSLLRDISDWHQSGQWVYAIDESGTFAVLNFRTGFHITYQSIREAPEQHQLELRKLRRFFDDNS